MARPRVYSDARIIAALKKKKGLVFLAAASIGCDPDTIYDRAKNTPAVAAMIRAQRGQVVDAAEEKLFAAIKRGAPWAIALTLKTLGKDRGYLDSKEVRHRGAPAGFDLGRLSDEDLDAIDAIFERAAAAAANDAAGGEGGEGAAPPR
jgi:hypothetical protein